MFKFSLKRPPKKNAACGWNFPFFYDNVIHWYLWILIREHPYPVKSDDVISRQRLKVIILVFALTLPRWKPLFTYYSNQEITLNHKQSTGSWTF